MSKHLECRVDLHGGAVLIRPVGRLDSAQVPRFDEIVMRQVRSAKHHVVLDLAELTFLSSSALRVLLAAARAARSRETLFLLCALQPQITELMSTVAFDRLLSIHPTREAASRVASAAPRPGAGATDAAGPAAAPVSPSPPAAPGAAMLRSAADDAEPEPEPGLFQPTWARYRRHLVLDLLLAAMYCGAVWLLSGRTPGWNDFGSIFALLAVLTALVSFGPAPLRRFFNALFA